jgi:CHASE3 domain sensor protein
MTIERKGYVATEADINTLSKSVYEADAQVSEGRTSYLRALVATTVNELGATPRLRAARTPKNKLTPDETAKQLDVLATVHERFYAVVTQVASDYIPGGKDKAQELNRKTNFARTAMSAVRRWVKAGNDLTGLPIHQVTKRSFATERVAAPKSAARLQRTLEARSKAFMSTALELIEADKDAALSELELLMGQLASQIVELSGSAVTDPRKAAEQHRPLRTGGSMFIPVSETQILRQQARPS